MGAGTTRRVVVIAFLFFAAALSEATWAESAPKPGGVDSAVTLTRPPVLAIEAALKGRSDAVTVGWTDQRLVKARFRLGLAVLVALSLLVAAAIVTLTRPTPGPGSALWRRWSVALRAPPLLALA